MKLKPILDRIVVKEDEVITKSAGGLILAGNAADKPNKGEVLAVGPGKMLEDGTLVVPSVSPGDKIIYLQGTGTIVKLEEQEYRVLQETDIIAIIR